MKAIAVHRDDRTPRVVERPVPEPADGEVLVRTLRVGIDGTDREVIAGVHGGFPAGEDHLVLGHEAVGVVEDANDTGFAEGDVVVPTVRRPPDGTVGTVGTDGTGGPVETDGTGGTVGTVGTDGTDGTSGTRGTSGTSGTVGTNEYFERGEPDYAPEGQYVERGIVGGHGFMAEYFTSPAEFLIELPPDLAAQGFLVEPISISEKAFELAAAARSSFHWSPESAIVLGNGSLGLLTLAMLAEDDRFERTYCLGRRDRPDPTIDLVEALGATYVDSRETPVDRLPAVHEGMDLVYEATGYAKHAFESIDALAPNGVAALLGVPDDWTFEVDGGRLHREFVLHNKAMVGSVNSGVGHFEAAVRTLRGLPEWFLDDLVTGVYGLDDLEAAFADDDRTIKTAVQFHAHEER